MKQLTRVLVVDDDIDWQSILTTYVKPLGYETRVSSNLSESIENIKKYVFHVALIDLRLIDNEPTNKDGFKVFKFLQDQNEITESIMLSAYGQVEDVRQLFIEFRAFDFIEKAILDNTITDKIKIAAEKADQKLMSVRLSQSFTNLPGTASQITSLDNKYRSNEFELFLKRLLYDFYPLLPHVKMNNITKNVDGTISFTTSLWSRMQGYPIVVWFGDYGTMKEYLESDKLPQLNIKQLVNIQKVEEVFDKISFPHFGGVVYEDKNSDFYDFNMS